LFSYTYYLKQWCHVVGTRWNTVPALKNLPRHHWSMELNFIPCSQRVRFYFYSHGIRVLLLPHEQINPIRITWVTKWQHCNNISCREYKGKLDVDGINPLFLLINSSTKITMFWVHYYNFEVMFHVNNGHLYSFITFGIVVRKMACVSQECEPLGSKALYSLHWWISAFLEIQC
jgi:hypothetical protein